MVFLGFLIFLTCFFPSIALAADQNFITPIFPIRAREYWRQGSDIKNFQLLYSLVPKNLPHTWLIHYDVLSDPEIIFSLKADSNNEIGLFLEVTRKLAEDSYVNYDWEHGSWSQANKIFLSGYPLDSRKRLIDRAFSEFKKTFGYYPSSYGAWYIDVWSMEYIRDHYQANITLGLADQYSTDGYQTWGQYLNLPYFVSKTSAIEPASSTDDSTRVLKVQWAPRHPLLAWGDSVSYSNYSAQVNDYYRGQKLDSTYFTHLLQDITINVQSPISQAVIGIEVGELELEYFPELKRQLDVIKHFNTLTMQQFNTIYRQHFDSVSPSATMSSQIGSRKITWTMTPQYRQGILEEKGHSTLLDLRYYHASNYRDNDQVNPDNRENLVRLVPQTFGFPLPTPIPVSGSEYGHYQGRFSILKNFLTKLSQLVPDLVYSSLDHQKYLGLRLDYEHVVGLRFPSLACQKFTFPFPVLENFISIKKRLIPNFTWEGKQELELKPFANSGKIYEKGRKYGQDELINLPGEVIFENSYYAVIK
jgi:hypothetical protein